MNPVDRPFESGIQRSGPTLGSLTSAAAAILHTRKLMFRDSRYGEYFSTVPAREKVMSEINRSLIILRPKQPFLDWACSLDEESKDLTLEGLNEDSTAYLIPEIWQDSDQEEFLNTCYDILFEEQLEGWWTE